jgi:hypothetical protein
LKKFLPYYENGGRQAKMQGYSLPGVTLHLEVNPLLNIPLLNIPLLGPNSSFIPCPPEKKKKKKKKKKK